MHLLIMGFSRNKLSSKPRGLIRPTLVVDRERTLSRVPDFFSKEKEITPLLLSVIKYKPALSVSFCSHSCNKKGCVQFFSSLKVMFSSCFSLFSHSTSCLLVLRTLFPVVLAQGRQLRQQEHWAGNGSLNVCLDSRSC